MNDQQKVLLKELHDEYAKVVSEQGGEDFDSDVDLVEWKVTDGLEVLEQLHMNTHLWQQGGQGLVMMTRIAAQALRVGLMMDLMSVVSTEVLTHKL